MSRSTPGRLLVVDDSRVNRLMLVHGLEQEGHQVASAVNGREAMEMLRSEPFDLILLDIEMPEMNGFQVLEALLQDPLLREMPVIMTSASDELDRVVRCIEMGAEDSLTKPRNPILLRARVNASLEKKRLRDQQRRLFRTFATPEVAEELLKSGFALGGKKVQATAMFADIRSFTTIAETQDPAATIELLNDFFALSFDAISKYRGTLNQMLGDGLMAVFGAPIAYEDHRERAVRAALEMVDNLAAFNARHEALGKPAIRVGVGIASGVMIAGYTGTEERATYTCVGDTVNLAARLETHTKTVGSMILVDENTYQGMPKDIRLAGLGAVRFKGKKHAVNVYSVLTRAGGGGPDA